MVFTLFSRAITLNSIILLIIYHLISYSRGSLQLEKFCQAAILNKNLKSTFFWLNKNFILAQSHLTKNYKATETRIFSVFSGNTLPFYLMQNVKCSASLPAREFRGQLGEEVGGGPGAGVGQWAGIVVRQGGWSRRGRVDRGATISQLSPMKGAANCGASG